MTEKTFCVERVASPIGAVLVVTDSLGPVAAVDWEECEMRLRRLLRSRCATEPVLAAHEGESAAAEALRRYFAGDVRALEGVEVQLSGTAFQREVWAGLRRIPAGTSASYARVAAQMGRPRAVRAVARANATNPISIVVPCHRVVGADGGLAGYAGGLHRKEWLLEHEARWARLASVA